MNRLVLCLLVTASLLNAQEALRVSEPQDTTLKQYFQKVDKPVKRVFQFSVPKPGGVVVGVAEDGTIYPLFLERVAIERKNRALHTIFLVKLSSVLESTPGLCR